MNGSKLLTFGQFVNEKFEASQDAEDMHMSPTELNKFKNFFEVLDFFGGDIPHIYSRAKQEAEDAGYELPMPVWQDALMQSMDGNAAADDMESMLEATAAELAAKKADIAKREAAIAQQEAALATKKSAIKPDAADALQQKAAIEAEEAKIAQQRADLAKELDAVNKTQPTA